MLSAFFTRLTSLFHAAGKSGVGAVTGGLPQQNPNMVSTEHLRRAEDLVLQQAERDEYIYVCTDNFGVAANIGFRYGYSPSKVRQVRTVHDVCGLHGKHCVMATGWSLLVQRSGGELLTAMRANSWELVDEMGWVIQPTWDGCHVRT